jgi:hypothetical protein
MNDELKEKPRTRKGKASLRSWMIILGIAILFLCYGLFMFFVVGDKGPPVWDFGVVEDIPGESIYSTHPGKSAPEPQHVSQKSPQAGVEGKKGNP